MNGYMFFVLCCLALFGIGTYVLVKWTIEKPSPFKICSSIAFVATLAAAIWWALREFSNQT